MHFGKKITALLTAFVMLLSLTACDPMGTLFPDYDTSRLEHIFGANKGSDRVSGLGFEDMTYERPDADELVRLTDNIKDLLDAHSSRKETISALNDFFDAYSHFGTMLTLAMIRSDMDLSDEHCAEEYDYCTGASAAVDKCYDDVMLACARSHLSEYLDTYYFGGMLEEGYGDEDGIYADDELVSLQNEESRLLTKYRAVYAKFSAADSYDVYEKHNAEAAQIFIDLVRVRRQIAEKCGYESYREYCYDGFGRSYDAQELEEYCGAVKKYFVPIYEKLAESGRLDTLYDDFEKLSSADCLSTVASAASNMGGDISAAMKYLKSEGLYCIGSSENMYDGSYVTYLTDFDAPFLFSRTSGYQEDILTVGHEFGHFTDDYINEGLNLDNDSSEMFSQAMEFLITKYLPDEKLASQLESFKLVDAVSTYVDQMCFNEFENAVWELDDDELTVKNLNSLYARLASEYGGADGVPAKYLPYMWTNIQHMFESPFYVISYCVSCSAAFELYNMELDRSGAGLKAYNKLLKAASDGSFLDILDGAGLPSPISEDSVKRLADSIGSKLF